MDAATLAATLTKAQEDFTNGRPTPFTDEEYDALVERLRDLDPTNAFFGMIGALPLNAETVALPIPLPSINKLKTAEEISAWVSKYPADRYQISAKLDGCSALWLPTERRLYTRGDGMKGRDISAFVPHLKGLVKAKGMIVRGELIIPIGSKAVPEGGSARNIVAGALNRKEVDPALFSEIHFVAYELLSPRKNPCDGFLAMAELGFNVAISVAVTPDFMTTDKLKTLFSDTEKTSRYKLDGLVIAPNRLRPSGYLESIIAEGTAKNPADRMAWKTRIDDEVAATTVTGVEWNISAKGILAPTVLVEEVRLSDANINRVTGKNARFIFANGIGPGASVLIQRCGDVIPGIVKIYTPVAPGMPARYEWDGPEATAVNIRPPAGEEGDEAGQRQLLEAVKVLGAEEVGPGAIVKLYDDGLETVGALYAADSARLEAAGFSAKMAAKIHAGLRARKHGPWTEITLMVASTRMPRGVGSTKLAVLFAHTPNVGQWSTARLATVQGVGAAVIREIVTAVPAYLKWRHESRLEPDVSIAAVAEPVQTRPTIVFTGGEPPKEIMARLKAMGHGFGDNVKADSILVYKEPGSTKYKKALAVGATMIPYSEFIAQFS
jgi:DNA ligase (NAD+)